MSEAGKDVVRRAWAAYDAGDEAAFAACVTSDWREHDPVGSVATIADANASMRAQRGAFRKQTEIVQIVAEGDIVAARSVTRSTHVGRYLDVEPTGRVLELHQVLFNRIAGGRIAETWQVTGSPGLYTQLTGRAAPGRRDNQS
ncbi:MAG: hypothetical protein QOH08_2306, partial [Chloroflexota bacterium]|nr:hypothetical protein [Chloroflexota bacterium]